MEPYSKRMAKTAHTSLKLLVIDDDAASLELVEAAIAQSGLRILTAGDANAGFEMFIQNRPQVVLLDLVMPKIDGMQLLERMIAVDPAADVILMTGHYSTESAVEAIQKGASDYLTKPLNVEKLRQKIGDLIAEGQRRHRASELDRELLNTFQFEGMIGRNPLMLEVFAKIRRVAPHFRIVLVTGPTGTGKELVATALHKLSPASASTLAVCNCSAIVETLFESELFGHVRGAFTGANQDKLGLFEYANHGTVFLDEIGEMPLAAQAKLLRLLQNQEVQRVGSPAVRHVDVRVIAATNRDLATLVAEKKFREDLYYRLCAVEIALPRLTDRKDDLPLLQRHLLEKYSEQYKKNGLRLSSRAQALLSRYSWPGNVRELENVISNACMMAEGDLIDVADLPERLRTGIPPTAANAEELLPLEEIQRRHILRVLEHVNGDKAQAAEILGVARGTVYAYLAKMQSAAVGKV